MTATGTAEPCRSKGRGFLIMLIVFNRLIPTVKLWEMESAAPPPASPLRGEGPRQRGWLFILHAREGAIFSRALSSSRPPFRRRHGLTCEGRGGPFCQACLGLEEQPGKTGSRAPGSSNEDEKRRA